METLKPEKIKACYSARSIVKGSKQALAKNHQIPDKYKNRWPVTGFVNKRKIYALGILVGCCAGCIWQYSFLPSCYRERWQLAVFAPFNRSTFH